MGRDVVFFAVFALGACVPQVSSDVDVLAGGKGETAGLGPGACTLSVDCTPDRICDLGQCVPRAAGPRDCVAPSEETEPPVSQEARVSYLLDLRAAIRRMHDGAEVALAGYQEVYRHDPETAPTAVRAVVEEHKRAYDTGARAIAVLSQAHDGHDPLALHVQDTADRHRGLFDLMSPEAQASVVEDTARALGARERFGLVLVDGDDQVRWSEAARGWSVVGPASFDDGRYYLDRSEVGAALRDEECYWTSRVGQYFETVSRDRLRIMAALSDAMLAVTMFASAPVDADLRTFWLAMRASLAEAAEALPEERARVAAIGDEPSDYIELLKAYPNVAAEVLRAHPEHVPAHLRLAFAEDVVDVLMVVAVVASVAVTGVVGGFAIRTLLALARGALAAYSGIVTFIGALQAGAEVASAWATAGLRTTLTTLLNNGFMAYFLGSYGGKIVVTGVDRVEQQVTDWKNVSRAEPIDVWAPMLLSAERERTGRADELLALARELRDGPRTVGQMAAELRP